MQQATSQPAPTFPPRLPFRGKTQASIAAAPSLLPPLPPRRPGRNSAHQLWSSGAAGGNHRAPQGGAASPRAAASLSLAQLSFIVGVARRPPPCYFLPPTSISRRAGAGGGAASERGAGRCGRGRGGAAPQPLYRAARGALPAPWERGEAEEEEAADGGGKLSARCRCSGALSAGTLRRGGEPACGRRCHPIVPAARLGV